MSVGALFGVAAILFFALVLPIFIVLHFITRWKQAREFSRDDERLLEELWELSQRLEDRLETLERILEDDIPKRRSRHESAYMEH
jgi:phage shock protein B